MIDTDELRKLAEAATPGPWRVNLTHQQALKTRNRFVPAVEGPNGEMVAPLVVPRDYRYGQTNKGDAEFIAAANPQAVLALLDECGRLREALKEMAEVH